MEMGNASLIYCDIKRRGFTRDLDSIIIIYFKKSVVLVFL